MNQSKWFRDDRDGDDGDDCSDDDDCDCSSDSGGVDVGGSRDVEDDSGHSGSGNAVMVIMMVMKKIPLS